MYRDRLVAFKAYSGPNKRGRLLARGILKVQVLEESTNSKAIARMICMEKINPKTEAKIKGAKILVDQAARLLTKTSERNYQANDFVYIPSPSIKNFRLPKLGVKEYEFSLSKANIDSTKLALSKRGDISAFFHVSGNSIIDVFNRLGTKRFSRTVSTPEGGPSSFPVLTYFLPDGVAARSQIDFEAGHTEERFDLKGTTVASEVLDYTDARDEEYIDDPQNGYLLRNVSYFVFCETWPDFEGIGGSYQYIRRIGSDSTIASSSVFESVFTEPLAPKLMRREGKRFPWENPDPNMIPEPDREGFDYERACFEATLIDTKVDSFSNTYFVYALNDILSPAGDYSIYQIRKIST